MGARLLAPARGSAPRMRGAHDPAPMLVTVSRIIPADAGSTHQVGAEKQRKADHPRGCGEHPDGLVGFNPSGGSSPRMRGALAVDSDGRLLHGIIPADAGSTLASLSPCAPAVDHPRGCGEHTVTA